MTVELRDTTVLVVGLGKSGISAARVLSSRGARVILNDHRQLGDLDGEVRVLADGGARLELGGHDPALFTQVDRIVVSPGVPPLPALSAAEAAGVPILSEIELAAGFIEGVLVGITGTNGKSTVTSLVGEMCRHTGRSTFVGGNLGTPICDIVGTPAAAKGGYAVVELSSFQLERVDRLHINAAALLNITADHLDRYASLEAYADAKANIFRNQTSADAAVVGREDTLCNRLARRGGGRVLGYGGRDGDACVRDGRVLDPQLGLSLPVAEIGLRGRHNLDNVCAAVLLAREAGVPLPSIVETLRTFQGLPHRSARVRTLDGVEYVDDSKATNVGAAVAAVDGLAADGARIVLIAGGKDKGGSYAPLCERLAVCGRAVVLIGEAADLIASALSGMTLPIARAANMLDAVELARGFAQPGDVVLLSPACASFDMFRSYSHRGDTFQDAVRSLAPGRAP